MPQLLLLSLQALLLLFAGDHAMQPNLPQFMDNVNKIELIKHSLLFTFLLMHLPKAVNLQLNSAAPPSTMQTASLKEHAIGTFIPERTE